MFEVFLQNMLFEKFIWFYISIKSWVNIYILIDGTTNSKHNLLVCYLCKTKSVHIREHDNKQFGVYWVYFERVVNKKLLSIDLKTDCVHLQRVIGRKRLSEF